jgi:hypothetical protein
MDVAGQRLRQQFLVGTPCTRPEKVVESLLAVQSQDYPGAKWAVAQRTRAGEDAAVDDAFRDGRILRTHAMRPTWHFVTPGDIHWLLALTAPRVHAVNALYYRRYGIDAATVKRSRARIEKALSRGEHLTRDELARAIDARDATMTGERLGYLVMHAELDALICSGAMRGKQHTYALLEERAPRRKKLRRDEALAELARRFVCGHGPAQAQDLAWWSGLTIADARRGLEASKNDLEQTVIDGKAYWFGPARAARRWPRPAVHLLPNYDEFLIAFRDRSFTLDPDVEPVMSVFMAHFVVVNGRLVGGYRRTVASSEVSISAELLRALTTAERKGLEAAAGRYAQSLGLKLRLNVKIAAPRPRRR